MRTKLLFVFLSFFIANHLLAQRLCNSYTYQQKSMQENPLLKEKLTAIEAFTQKYIAEDGTAARTDANVITIPVVIHILYNSPLDKIEDATIAKQMEVINQCFRRKHADTANTPLRFKSLAADCEIEFKLAISDPQKRATSGVVRKYTPIQVWQSDDKMKFSSQMGDDAWDSKSYLNIWVCNMENVAGYATAPGSDPAKDGVVLSFGAFGVSEVVSGFEGGKTVVHEIGHWLNLKHIWGDDVCGDDAVSDTPKQGYPTMGCPSGITTSCNNDPNGNMYMNYMDFTDDRCTNLFTIGQMNRMRALFVAGGPRASLLASKGLNMPLIFDIPLPEADPRWLHPQLFPNPATNTLTLDLTYDPRWLGRTITIVNMQGIMVKQVVVASKIQLITITDLKPGMYILYGKKEDGESLKQKFVKL